MAQHSARRNLNSTSESIDTVLQTLVTADKVCFATFWLEAFRCPLPTALNRRVAQACLIYRLQELHLGGLSHAAKRRLVELLPVPPTMSSPQTRVRRYKAGTRLMRTWRGRTYVVTIASPGYLYDGRSYRNLSVIAREITGTPWSGPVFFGLKSKAVVGARP